MVHNLLGAGGGGGGIKSIDSSHKDLIHSTGGINIILL